MNWNKTIIILVAIAFVAVAGIAFADKHTMMLEHQGINCTICHGKEGPKGVEMGKHPGQACTDCHKVVNGKVVTIAPEKFKKKAPPIAKHRKMMLEHRGIECTVCHGESGPKGVNMGNHPGQKCTDCHLVTD